MFTNIDDSDQMIPVGTFRSGPSVFVPYYPIQITVLCTFAYI